MGYLQCNRVRAFIADGAAVSAAERLTRVIKVARIWLYHADDSVPIPIHPCVTEPA